MEAGANDPLSMLEDLDVPNPKERARRLLTFLLGEADGYQRYAAEIGVDLSGGQGAGAQGGAGAQQAQQDIQTLVGGGQVQPPQQVTPEYVQTFLAYVQGPEFQNLDPTIQQSIQAYVQQLKATIDQQGAGAQPPAQPPTGGGPVPEMPPAQTPAMPQGEAQPIPPLQ